MTATRASLEKKPSDVSSMFDAVAARYDLMNDLASLGQVRVWREAVALAVDARPGLRVLDLAAGTCTSTASYRARGADAIACDFSLGMLQEGLNRNPEVASVAGDAMRLPFADATFDVTTISYGLRNVFDTSLALREMLRVTKPGGSLVIAEFSRPTWAPFRAVYNLYLERIMPMMSKAASSDDPAYSYLAESIVAWPAQEELARLIQEAGWREVAYRNLAGGIVAVHRARRPLA